MKMNMGFSKKTLWKYSLLTMNTLISMEVMVFFTCGVVALGGAGSEGGAYIVTGIGSLVLTISFWGCFAALRESYVLSKTYLGVTLLGIFLQTIFMIYFSVHKSEYTDMGRERIYRLWEEGTMDAVQQQYTCCGRDSYLDYLRNATNLLPEILPESCCNYKDCSISKNIHLTGCMDALTKFIDVQGEYFIMSIILLTALELLGIVSAFYLCKLVKGQEEKMERIIINE